MRELFLKIVNMSISASWLVLAVLALRLAFKKAPKWVNVLLWGIVAVRLICPYTLESSVSLIPDSVGNGEFVSEWADDYIGDIDIHHSGSEHYDAAVGAGRKPISDGEGGYYVVTKHDQLGEPATIENAVVPVLSVTWASGIVLLALYTAVSYWRLRRKVSEAVILRDNIFQSENVASPFVLGIVKPKVYLPYHMDGQDLSYVVAHEQAHIRRKDHWWKPLGFLLLTIHWFNPLMWLAYVLLCRDIELACDEKVIKELGNEQRADYTQALVACSVNRRMIAACPLAFGEVGVKERVKSVMNYKKPAFWVIVLAVIACVVVAVCFLTNPVGFKFDEATHTIVSANHFDMRNTDDAVAVEMNTSQISELSSRLAGIKDTKKSDEYGGFTPGYQISALLEDGTYIRISGYSLTENDMVDIEWNGKRYVVSDGEFQNYLSRICAGGDSSKAEGAVAGKTYLYDGEGFGGSFTITLYEDGTFTYYEGMLSSCLGFGSWTKDGDSITLTDDGPGGYGLVNFFKLDGDDLIFAAENSDNFVYVKVNDGEKFHCTGEAFKQSDGTDGMVQIMPGQKLSLNDVIMLSQKGYDLTWSDFEQFKYVETGSGLYIRVYEINEMYELWIGGGWIDEDPMYIYLALADDLDTRIDIRDGGVTEFIGADHSEVLLAKAINEAILDHFKASKPDGLLHCASFVSMAQQELCIDSEPANPMQVTVYGMALHEKYGYSGATFHTVDSWYNPVKLTFEKTQNGAFQLSDAWFPKYPAESAEQHGDDIYEQFSMYSEDLANSVLFELLDYNYLTQLKQECYDHAVRYGGVDTYSVVESLFEVIESSPATSSRPADYIDAHRNEYKELMYYGDYTLQYIFSKFHLEGNQTGLRGHLMREVLDDLAPEAQLRLYAETGQAYFDEWRAGAVRISEQHDMEWIKENQPAIWLFLRMDGE